ncbi:iron uptake porin [Pseudanabaena sp. PCC 6802]|uniref:iron uptake porin n=1 Tax=Pseudanabaena sp. PCC 6802 TaxID=118173 RepID=UPI000348E37D|nr:iron uptake porin [Pseudanabaena sp. PCC 6802]
MCNTWFRHVLSIPSGLLGASLIMFAAGANAEVIKNTEANSSIPPIVESSVSKTTVAPAVQTETAIAPTTSTNSPSTVPVISQVEPTTLQQISQYSNEGRIETAQVTSVSQLSDVKPTDWAFTALQSLVERYGCIAGYPDRTYRGQRAMTRYEFAAGVNACLDKINEIITAGLADKVSKEDFAAVQKLQEEFAAELAALKGRVDTLEAKTAQLEAQQFSTTTKLSGLAVFNVTGANGNNVRRETGRRVGGGPEVETVTRNPNLTFSGLVWLTLNTSFTGKDSLITQLAAGNAVSPANAFVSAGQFNNTGVPYFDQTSGATANSFILRELSYSFPIFGDKTRLIVGPRLNWYKYFDDNRFTSIFDGGTFNSTSSTFLSGVNRGAGAVIAHSFNDNLDLALGYLAESNEFFTNNDASNPNRGLFGGTNILSAELTYKPTKDINLRFLYSRYNLQDDFLSTIGGEPLLGLLDDGFGGRLNNAQSNIYAFNFDWLVAKGFGLFGRYAFNDTNVNAAIAARSGNINTQTFQIGLAFPDLFKEGAKATISFVMPNSITAGKRFFVSGSGDGGTQYDLELSYYLPLTKNIAIAPNFYYIFNANNFSGNNFWVANVSTRFSF